MKKFCKVDRRAAYFWYNKVKQILKSKEFESDDRTDKDVKVIHHLRDTEEQRKYNDEHYELFGFEIDENGAEIFNYGKYVVFWTKEHHTEYHKCSEETRNKIGNSIRLLWDDNYRELHSGENHYWYGKHHSDESIKKMSDTKKQYYKNNQISEDTCERISKSNKGKHSGENNSMYGRVGEKNPLYNIPRSNETKKKISDARKGHIVSEETRKKISDSHKSSDKCHGENTYWYGKNRDNATKDKISSTIKKVAEQYHTYKDNGGSMGWCEFQRYIRLSHSQDELNNE